MQVGDALRLAVRLVGGRSDAALAQHTFRSVQRQAPKSFLQGPAIEK